MELRRSKTLTIFILFALSLQLRLIFAQKLQMSSSTIVKEVFDGTHRKSVVVQSPPYVVSNGVPAGPFNALLRRYRNRNGNHKRAGKGQLMKREFLRAHNRVRRRANEPPLVWNKTLAGYARGWAQKRVADCRLVHSNGPYGESIFLGTGYDWKPADVVKSWAEENKYYDAKSNTCAPDQMCGHYTQIVWRDSKRIGCARAACKTGSLFVICVYDPPGNYEGENPFVSSVN